MKLVCSKCKSKRFWKLGSGEYRCKACRKDFKPRLVLNMKLTNKEWSRLIDLYLIGANGPTLKEELGKSMVTINKPLKLLRTVMVFDVPRIFSGTVEVDETYLGGQKKNKNKNQLRKERLNAHNYQESKVGIESLFRYLQKLHWSCCCWVCPPDS